LDRVFIQAGDETFFAGFDKILARGFEEHSINLLAGEPGTGKTILAQSVIFANARPEKRALYLTTAAEPLSKVIRFAQRFSFFKSEAVGTRYSLPLLILLISG
jgi:circadian clock protein KaiC